MRVRLVWIGAALAVGLLVAGCGSDNKTSTATTTTAPPPENAVATTTPSPSQAAAVNVATNPLGQILVDKSGKTLYVLTADTAGTSNCVDACAAAWPPLTATAVTVGNGLTASNFTLIARPDGTQQIAVNGRPLYNYAGDSKAGDTMGQGVNNVWYVVGVDGAPMGASGGAATNG